MNRLGFLSRVLAGMGLSFLLPPGWQLQAGGRQTIGPVEWVVAKLEESCDRAWDDHRWREARVRPYYGPHVFGDPFRYTQELDCPPGGGELLFLRSDGSIGTLGGGHGKVYNVATVDDAPIVYKWTRGPERLR